MNTIHQYAIQACAHLLLDGQLWHDVQMFVKDESSKPVSNADKQANVKSDLLVIFKDVNSVLLNFAIELGVLWLQSQPKV
jgi:hypothetical protein